MPKVISRIAPTPSGYLHFGNAFNFILTWILIRKQNGILHLRIDDLDSPRADLRYIEDIFTTLRWLGITWDYGPRTTPYLVQHYSQKNRIAAYHHRIDQLIGQGLVYACSCSRTSLQKGIPCNCRDKHLDLNTPDSALRIVTGEAPIIRFEDRIQGICEVPVHEVMPSFIVRRREGIPSYQIASLADDLEMKVNLIVRGADLIPSAGAQLWLSSRLHEKQFIETVFYHHRLFYNEKHIKLSKSAGDLSLKTMREQGMTADAFYRKISPLFSVEPVNSLFELYNAIHLESLEGLN